MVREDLGESVVSSRPGPAADLRYEALTRESASHLSRVIPGFKTSDRGQPPWGAHGWPGYSRLTKHNYAHHVTAISSSGDPAVVVMPSVHLVAGLLKRWLLGTFHGGVSREHLGYYLDEFTFRYNRRTSRRRDLLFYRLLEQGVRTGHTPTPEFFLGAGRGPTPKPPNHPPRNHNM